MRKFLPLELTVSALFGYGIFCVGRALFRWPLLVVLINVFALCDSIYHHPSLLGVWNAILGTVMMDCLFYSVCLLVCGQWLVSFGLFLFVSFLSKSGSDPSIMVPLGIGGLIVLTVLTIIMFPPSPKFWDMVAEYIVPVVFEGALLAGIVAVALTMGGAHWMQYLCVGLSIQVVNIVVCHRRAVQQANTPAPNLARDRSANREVTVVMQQWNRPGFDDPRRKEIERRTAAYLSGRSNTF